MASNKSDRSMSPSTLSEEGRRDLIARQHRALYGESTGMLSPGFSGDDSPREPAGNTKTAIGAGPRGPSPRAMDPFGAPGEAAKDLSRGDKTTSPAGPTAPGFTTFDGASATTPTGGDDGPHSRQLSKSTTAPVAGGMAPIGSRPNAQNQSISKRTTSPLPTGLSYGGGGFGSNDANNERSNSSNSNANAGKDGSSNAAMAAWGTGSGVWGSNKIGATSVWG